jgi:hypothetical protein
MVPERVTVLSAPVLLDELELLEELLLDELLELLEDELELLGFLPTCTPPVLVDVLLELLLLLEEELLLEELLDELLLELLELLELLDVLGREVSPPPVPAPPHALKANTSPKIPHTLPE